MTFNVQYTCRTTHPPTHLHTPTHPPTHPPSCQAKFEEALALCRSEAVQAADLARQESLAALKAELGTIRVSRGPRLGGRGWGSVTKCGPDCIDVDRCCVKMYP